MATIEQVKKAILEVAGNPTVGVIAELADEIAAAIVALDTPVREKRVLEPKETR